MTYAVIALAVAAFCIGLRVFRLVPYSLDVMATARTATTVIRARDLDDETKEAEVQRAALRLFKLFGIVTLGALGALALAALVIGGADLAGIATSEAVIDASLSWPVIVVTCIVMVAALAVSR